jgi:phosphohistidine phosphatase
MKYLYVMRHARAESAMTLSHTDSERQLTSEGERDAQIMGLALQQLHFRPELLLVSPALRTQTTARLFNAAFDQNPIPQQHVEHLYNAPMQTLLETAHELPDQYQSVLLLAHNPGVTQLVQNLIDIPVPAMNAGSIYLLLFQVTQWSLISSRNGEYGFFLSPHALQQD